MEIKYKGANCIEIKTKNAKILSDPIVPGLNIDSSKADIILISSENQRPNKKLKNQLVIDMPGEYESKNVSIQGVASRGHTEEEGKRGVTMYRLLVGEIRLLITGHIYPELNDEQIEDIGRVDILVIPVGGHGYTLDPVGATAIIKNLEPRIVVPTHYADPDINYEVAQGELQKFIDELGAQVKEDQKLVIKKLTDLPEQLIVSVVNRTS